MKTKQKELIQLLLSACKAAFSDIESYIANEVEDGPNRYLLVDEALRCDDTLELLHRAIKAAEGSEP